MIERVKAWFKEIWFEMTHDPNSPEGLKHRAIKLIKEGTPISHPHVSMLVKQALLKEKKDDKIPDPKIWENMTGVEKKRWINKQLEGEIT